MLNKTYPALTSTLSLVSRIFFRSLLFVCIFRPVKYLYNVTTVKGEVCALKKLVEKMCHVTKITTAFSTVCKSKSLT